MSKTSQKDNEIHPLIEEEVNSMLEASEEYENNEEMRVGIESEFGVLDGFEGSSSEARDRGIEDVGFADRELGAAMAETQTDPMTLDSLSDLEIALGGRENILAEQMSEEGLSLIRYGTHPFVDVDNIQTTDRERYDVLVNTFDNLREQNIGELPNFGKDEQIDPNTAAIPAGICSTQTNIQAEGFEDAVDKTNYAEMVLPYAIALSGNSRIVEGKDTGLSDTRMQLWEMNYNNSETPYKVGPLEGYIQDSRDWFSRLDIYFEDEDEDPDHLEDAISEHWKDVRIKLEEDPDTEEEYPVVEVRPLSMQPSVAEETAVHGFMIGRIAYAQETDEDLILFEQVLANREKALMDGLSTEEMFYNREGRSEREDLGAVLDEEISRAEEGLKYLGIEDPGYMNILRERLDQGTPSTQSADIFNGLRGQKHSTEEALRQSVPVIDEPSWSPQNLMETHYDRK